MSGAIITPAFRAWRTCRDEFELYREAAYVMAHEACAGVLLNARGEQRGIDPWSLFIGSDIRAYAYASEELVAWWAENPRQTYERFERTWYEQEHQR